MQQWISIAILIFLNAISFRTFGAEALLCPHVFQISLQTTSNLNLNLRQTLDLAEVKKTEKTISTNGFTTARDLTEYQSIFKIRNEDYLKGPFTTKLASLQNNHRWLDSGAGRAYAQKTFLKSFNHSEEAPELIALSYKKPALLLPVFSKKFKYQEGRWLEDIPNKELGKFDLITDLYGPFSYSKDPIQVLNKYLDLLSVNGEIYFSFEFRSNIIEINGKAEPLSDWLLETAKFQNDFEIEQISLVAFRIRLLKPTQFHWPQLNLSQFSSNLPPFRRFEETR